MSAAISAMDEQRKQRVYGRPFPKGVAQSELFLTTRRQMEAETIADLERDGRKVSSADKLLVQKYVQLLRSKNHSSVNTALKVWMALAEKYSGKGQPVMSAFDKYVAELAAKKDATS
jgi:hypothetical protein